MQHSEFVNSTVKAIKIYLNLDKLVYIAFVPINLAVALQSWILFRINRQFKKMNWSLKIEYKSLSYENLEFLHVDTSTKCELIS